MIKLHDCEGGEVWINPANINLMARHRKEAETEILLNADASRKPLIVKETPAEILELMSLFRATTWAQR